MMETFGERLKHLIKSSDIKTIKGFAKKAGVHENSVSRILSGKNYPSYELVIACLDIFPDVDVNWLLRGETRDELLELENKQLKEQVRVYRNKLQKAVKLSSNRTSPQLSLAM